jgi:hypothetical protein
MRNLKIILRKFPEIFLWELKMMTLGFSIGAGVA